MGQQDFTPYQQKIIKRYYNNESGVKQQHLAELVTELYLAEGKKRQRVWSQAVAAMQKLEVPQARASIIWSPRTIQFCWRNWSKSSRGRNRQ